jgi:glycogen synthase
MAKICLIQLNANPRFLNRIDREATTLGRQGHEVVLLAIMDPDTPAVEERDSYKVKRVAIWTRKVLPKSGWTLPIKAVETFLRMSAAARRERADVYDPHDLEPLAIGWLAARMHLSRSRRARLVYDMDELCTGRATLLARPRWYVSLLEAYERAFIGKADVTITSDESRADAIVEYYGARRPRVVRNVPYKLADLPEPVDLSEFRRGRHLLIYEGILSDHRGIEPSIAAMRELDDHCLLLLGYGARRDRYQWMIDEAGLADRVRIHDAVPFAEMMRYARTADAGLALIQGVCESYRRAAPSKLYDYLMVGTPVIASDLPEMRAVVEAHDVGELVADPSDPAAIAAAVRCLFADPERFEEMRRRARDAALSEYNWDIERERLLAAWAEVL